MFTVGLWIDVADRTRNRCTKHARLFSGRIATAPASQKYASTRE